MPEEFDPYYRWLGIAPAQQPANHYRLLGLELFEADSEVIREAAERQMGHIRRYQLGARSDLSQRILNELGAAKGCLLDPAEKASYDRRLRKQLGASDRNTSPTETEPPEPGEPCSQLTAGPAHFGGRIRTFSSVDSAEPISHPPKAHDELRGSMESFSKSPVSGAPSRFVPPNQAMAWRAGLSEAIVIRLRQPAWFLSTIVLAAIAAIAIAAAVGYRLGAAKPASPPVASAGKVQVAAGRESVAIQPERGEPTADNASKKPSFVETSSVELPDNRPDATPAKTSDEQPVQPLAKAPEMPPPGEPRPIEKPESKPDAAPAKMVEEQPAQPPEKHLDEQPPEEALFVGQLKPTISPTPPHVLLGRNPQSGEWLRLAPSARLMSGTQLLVPPAFSPEIVMSHEVQISFAGPSLVRPMTTSVSDEVGLAVSYCRAVLCTAGVAGTRIHLDLAGRKGVVTFLDPTSELALEVKRYLAPGANPESVPVQIVIQMFITVGRIQWEDTVAGAASIDQGHVHMIVADRAQTQTLAASELPAWVRRKALTGVDRMAATELESFLSTERSVILPLKERTEDRQPHVRALAARSLAYLDYNDAVVLALADDRQRSFWVEEFDALRASVRRSPESAVRVRETLKRICGEDAEKLYRMTWGFSPQQLQGGDAGQLVANLDQDSLCVRVMALENLRRITQKTLFYRPEASKSRRKSTFRSWQDQLQNGGIIYATLPFPTISMDAWEP